MPVPENAETGWWIYQDSDYELTLSEINDELNRRDLSSVSQRMYSHYRKLHRYGFEQYLPINQLDVKTMSDPVWDRSLRGRYLLHRVDEPVRVYALARNVMVNLDGIAEEVSEGEVVLRFQGGQALEQFERGASLGQLQVIFTRTSEMHLAEVSKVTIDTRRRRVTVRASFSRISSAESFLPSLLLTTRTLHMTVGVDPSAPLLARTTQQIFWLFSAAEGVRLAVDEALREADSGQRYAIPSNRLAGLRVASPMSADLLAAIPVVVGMSILISRVVDARKSWWEGTRARHEASVAEEEVLRLRWERDRRDVIGSIDLSDVSRAIAQAVRAELAPVVDSSEAGDQAARAALTNFALPATSELVESADGDIALDAPADEVSGQSNR